MGRPPKYATAKEAAENNLYSKLLGSRWGLTLGEFIDLVTAKCHLCGVEPHEALFVKRVQDKYVLHWNYILDGKPTCKMCKALAKDYGIPQILRHSARIMAKRMHDKRKGIVIPGPGITLAERSPEDT